MYGNATKGKIPQKTNPERGDACKSLQSATTNRGLITFCNVSNVADAFNVCASCAAIQLVTDTEGMARKE